MNVYFVKVADATFYLTRTDSGKAAIQLISDKLNLTFYLKDKSWYEMVKGLRCPTVINRKLKEIHRRLKGIKNEQSYTSPN